MPSKRKKNKRRMRRVQAQRRVLEEQHAASPPVKASPGIAVSAPPSITPKKVPKSSAPPSANIPVPTTVHIVETPKAEPKPDVKEPAAKPILVEETIEMLFGRLLTQTPAKVNAESHIEVEAQARVTEEATIESTPPVDETSTDESDVEPKSEPTTEPVHEVKAPEEVPVENPAETETQTVDIMSTKTETEHTLGDSEAEEEAEISVEEITDSKVEWEVALREDTSALEPVKEPTEEPVVEDVTSDRVSDEAEAAANETGADVGSAVEGDTEIPKAEDVTETFSSAAPTQEGDDKEVKVLVEEVTATVHAETVTAAEDASVQFAEISEVTDVLPPSLPPLLEEAEGLVTETREEAADSLDEGVAVSESVSASNDAVAAPAVIHQETVSMSGNSIQTEIIDETPVDPEPAEPAAPADDNQSVEQKCLTVSSEEPHSEVCDMSCPLQLPVESVQLGSAEISIETTLNGQIVPEVPIEDAPLVILEDSKLHRESTRPFHF